MQNYVVVVKEKSARGRVLNTFECRSGHAAAMTQKALIWALDTFAYDVPAEFECLVQRGAEMTKS